METLMRLARHSLAKFAEFRSARQPRAAVATLLVMILLSPFLFAADVTGKWKGPMQSGGDSIFDLKSAKDVITGNMLGYDGKQYPVSDGKLDGENLSMKVAFEWQGQPV